MNKLAMDLDVQAAVKHRFRGHENMLPRVPMYYPKNLEREYLRIVDAYMSLLGRCLSDHLPTLRRAVEKAQSNTRLDDFDEFSNMYYGMNDVIADVFMRVQRDFNRRDRNFNLRRRINTLANSTRHFSVSQWRRVVQSSLGINISQDYYMGEFYRQAIGRWVDTNVGLIKSVPQSAITDMRNIVQESWQSGTLTRDLATRLKRETDAFPFNPQNAPVTQEMLDAYAKHKRRAQFWAQDQMSKLNGDLEEQQQKDAGVKEYIWTTLGDAKVRGDPDGLWPDSKISHFAMEGVRCKRDDPTVYHNGVEWVPRKGNMPMKHPKKDYRCRCIGLPVFNLPNLSLPWERGESE